MFQEVDVLLDALGLLRESWCQNAFAKTASGKSCEVFSPLAVEWDLAGAVTRAAGSRLAAKPILDVMAASTDNGITDWNDRADHAEVLALVYETIAVFNAKEVLA